MDILANNDKGTKTTRFLKTNVKNNIALQFFCVTWAFVLFAQMWPPWRIKEVKVLIYQEDIFKRTTFSDRHTQTPSLESLLLKRLLFLSQHASKKTFPTCWVENTNSLSLLLGFFFCSYLMFTVALLWLMFSDSVPRTVGKPFCAYIVT